LECEHLGYKLSEKHGVVVYTDMIGLLPIKEEYLDTFNDIILVGKLVFYDDGFIFVDNKINAIVLPYKLISNVNFYVDDTKKTEWWMEFLTEDIEDSNVKVADLFP
jgi:hypothetical protein